MILLVLGPKHLHVTKPGSGTDSWLQKDLTKALWQFPGCYPKFPAAPRVATSGWLQPSSVARLESFCTSTAESLPCAQRDNSFVAKLLGAELVDGVSPSVSAPRSISFFHPLSLFAFFMAEEVPFHKGSGRRALGWTFCKVSPCNPFARGVEAVLSQGLSFCKGSSQAAFGKTCPFARVSLLQGLCKPATLLQGFPFARGERLTLLQGCPWQGFAFCKAFLYLFPKVCLLQGFAFCKASYTFLQWCAFCKALLPFCKGWNLPFCKGLIFYPTTY